MALTQDIQNSTELAKSQVVNSGFSDDYKKLLMQLLNTTAIATNGITPEEKIQKMTEAIQMLAVSQVSFIAHIDEHIVEINKKQCEDCKAMKMAIAIEEKEKNERIISQYKKEHDILSDDFATNQIAYRYSIVKNIFLKPYIYIFGCVAVFSPFLSDIVKMILDFFSK